jgi:hypothetical protein
MGPVDSVNRILVQLNIGGYYNHGEAGAEALAQEKEARFLTHLRLRAPVERSYYRALAALERIIATTIAFPHQAVRRTG